MLTPTPTGAVQKQVFRSSFFISKRNVAGRRPRQGGFPPYRLKERTEESDAIGPMPLELRVQIRE